MQFDERCSMKYTPQVLISGANLNLTFSTPCDIAIIYALERKLHAAQQILIYGR